MKKLKLNKNEIIYIGKFILTGWKAPLNFYAWICSDCGELVINHKCTHYQHLICPLCLDKRIKEYNLDKGEIINDPL